MRAITPEEIERIAGGLAKKTHHALRPMMIKPPSTTLSTINVYPPPGSGGGDPPPTSPPPPPPPPGGGGGGGGSSDPVQQAAEQASAGYSFMTAGMDVYLPFIYNHENTSPLIVNVPSSNSGITVGYGDDLQFRTQTELEGDEQAGFISQSMYNILEPFTGKTGTAAASALAASGLQYLGNGEYEFPSSDASMLTQLSTVVYGGIMENVNTSYQSTTSNVTQSDGIKTQESLVYLPLEAQTAMTDLSVWYGASNIQTKLNDGDFWDNFTQFKWTDAVNVLHTVANEYMAAYNNGTDPNGKGFANRANSDAELLQWDIDHGELVNGLGTNQGLGGNDPTDPSLGG